MKPSPLPFIPVDDRARDGKSYLFRRDNHMALAMWNGERFVYPASYGRALDFEPLEYYIPGTRHG